MGLSLDMLRLVDARIAAAAQKLTAVGTVTEVQGTIAYVAFDGSSLPMPVKYVAGLTLAADSRVTLTRYGGDWVVTGSFNRAPTTITPTLLNGWSNFGSGHAPAAYWQGSDGAVHCEGLIAGGTVTSGTVLFQLDPGFRPAAIIPFPAVSASGFARLDVGADGTVKTNTGVSATYVSLSGIHFLARQ